MADLTLGIAFVAGIISFLSPCVLPLVPAFLSYLAGTSLSGATDAAMKLKIFINSLLFVLGFALVFSLIGVLLNSVLANVSYAVQQWLARIGGIIIILFALYLLKLIKLPFLEREHKLNVKSRASYFTSFLFGAAFAAGWTPCVGAVLGSVLTLAITNPAQAFPLLFSYTLGLGLPFLLVGIFTSQAAHFISKSGKWLVYFNYVVGVLLLILGVLVFTNQLSLIANFSLLNKFLLK
ncbi:MAG TPA: cytochrome c biogenesis protein CcdA [Candidatus Binatia bacterium]|nr:cytochrome c biogenesis protein CcdA [Candidatus Binatia bacterium]